MPINNRRIQKIQPSVVRNKPNTVTRILPKTVTNSVNNANTKPQMGKSTSSFGTISKIWDNEVVYLIGGGPSLKDFDWSKLAGKKVIAINRAFQVLPNADVLYWTDSRFYRWYKNEIDNFKGVKYTCRAVSENPGDITVVKPTNTASVDLRPDHISCGNNSGFGAINLAAKLGATRIYLLGYDMSVNEKSTHWHSGYSVAHNNNIYAKMQSELNLLPDQLKKLNIEVFNANPKSNLTAFRRVSLECALNNNPIIPTNAGY